MWREISAGLFFYIKNEIEFNRKITIYYDFEVDQDNSPNSFRGVRAISIGGEIEMKNQSAKRIKIVSVKLVKESSLLYKERSIRSPEDGYNPMNHFLGELEREAFIVISLDTKNQPLSINICQVGSLNASIIHPREVMKSAILSNASSIMV